MGEEFLLRWNDYQVRAGGSSSWQPCLEDCKPILILEIKPLMGETNFTHGSNQKYSFLFVDTHLRAPQATFKAVPMTLDMTKALQTKCKTCFGGLHAYYNFSSLLSLTPPFPWVWQGKRPYDSTFLTPFPQIEYLI